MKNLTIIILLFASASYAQQTKRVFETQGYEDLIDMSFSAAERESMQDGLMDYYNSFKALHDFNLPNSIPPALVFDPLPVGFLPGTMQKPREFELPQSVELPSNPNALAFYSVAELSVLIKNQKISSEDLTKLYLSRLKKYSDTLECTVLLLEDRALKKARIADKEIAEGNYRGPLHGIPFGLKDLFAVEGTVTSWGAMPYKDQVINETATVVSKLEEAGAILVAKLTLGALAMGDVWYGGKTRNPWNLAQGSSGSSAGPGAATAAGLVGFSIGTETQGSIISPSNRNGLTGLRPTFGRVSRSGAMALSWSMDKAGPMCRTALDCALVLEAIYGSDGLDKSVIDAAYNYDASRSLKSMKIGYFKNLFDENQRNKKNDSLTLLKFRELGIDIQPVALPDNIPYEGLSIILEAEAGAAFDALIRSGRDDLLVRQDKYAWPSIFKGSRFIPAVEYIQANRIRYMLIQEMDKLFREYDAILTPSFGGRQLMITNLTGHPAVCIPNGFNASNSPTSFTVLGRLFDEGTILHLARVYQEMTNFDEMHPPFFMD